MYDPSTARFLSTDPLGLTNGSNLYSYCSNDPINKTDPSGKEEFAIGDNPKLTKLLEENGIGYTIHDVQNVSGNSKLPVEFSYRNVKVIIIDAKDVEKARAVPAIKNGYPGLFSFTEHMISWDDGKSHDRLGIKLDDTVTPKDAKYYLVAEKYMGYYPLLNQILRYNYYAGYRLDLLKNARDFPTTDWAKSERGARDTVRDFAKRGDIISAYRRYKAASRQFPLYPGGGGLRGFLELLIRYLPDGEVKSILRDVVKDLSDDLINAVLTVISGPQDSVKPVLRSLIGQFLDSIEGLDDNTRKIILQVLDLILDDRPLDVQSATDLVQSLLKLDKRTTGVSDLIDLLSGKKIENCDGIITLLKNLGVEFLPGDERKLRACCDKAIKAGNLSQDDLIKEILGLVDPAQKERLSRVFDQAKIIVQELKSSNPNTKRIVDSIAKLLPEFFDKNDPRLKEFIQILMLLGNAGEAVQRALAAKKDFENGNNEAAVENGAKAADAAGQPALARWMRDNKAWLIIVLGIFAGLGLNKFTDDDDSSATDCPPERDDDALKRSLGGHSYPENAKPQAHHIFPVEYFGTDTGLLLCNLGIDLNSKDNGVWLPSCQYKGRKAAIHRGRSGRVTPGGAFYKDVVLQRFMGVKTKSKALKILDDIRNELLSNTLKVNQADETVECEGEK